MSGAEATTITWTGDGADKVIEAPRTVNSVKILNVTDGVDYVKTNDMADGFARKEAISGAKTFADDLIELDGAGNITFLAAENVNAKVFHAEILC